MRIACGQYRGKGATIRADVRLNATLTGRSVFYSNEILARTQPGRPVARSPVGNPMSIDQSWYSRTDSKRRISSQSFWYSSFARALMPMNSDMVWAESRTFGIESTTTTIM